jgi:hypothetical protein
MDIKSGIESDRHEYVKEFMLDNQSRARLIRGELQGDCRLKERARAAI